MNVVRRNSLRRDSTISDNNSTAQNQTSEEKQDKCEANSTFLICDHIIKDDAEDGSHSDSPTHSVESYESDDNNIDKSDANIINDSDEANETEEVTTKEKSAIRVSCTEIYVTQLDSHDFVLSCLAEGKCENVQSGAKNEWQ